MYRGPPVSGQNGKTKMANLSADAGRADISPRKVALIAALGLLGMAVLAPFALFGVLNTLVDTGNPTATVANIIESEGTFRLAIAAFLVVTMLDVVVAWAVYVLLRPVSSIEPSVGLPTSRTKSHLGRQFRRRRYSTGMLGA